LLIGTTKDEMTLFTYPNEALDNADDDTVRAVLAQLYGDGAEALRAAYCASRPKATPKERLIAAMTDRFRVGSIRIAERKAAQGRAPVWMYRFDYETDAFDGALGAPHAVEIAYVFGNPDAADLSGKREGRQELADLVSAAWVSFARAGNPQTTQLPDWPTYDVRRRATMILDIPCRTVDDPDAAERQAWDGLVAGL
jgi:para-nitrobenzyl esterase